MKNILKLIKLKYLPVFILTITAFLTFFRVILSDQELELRLLLGLGGAGTSCILYIRKNSLMRIFMLSILILGSLNLIFFTKNMVTITFEFGFFKFLQIQTIEIQLFSFLNLIFFLLVEWEWINFGRHLIRKKSELEKLDNESRMIQFFLKKYSEKTQKELKEIIEKTNGYRPEAIKAAKSLLDKNVKKGEV